MTRGGLWRGKVPAYHLPVSCGNCMGHPSQATPTSPSIIFDVI